MTNEAGLNRLSILSLVPRQPPKPKAAGSGPAATLWLSPKSVWDVNDVQGKRSRQMVTLRGDIVSQNRLIAQAFGLA